MGKWIDFVSRGLGIVDQLKPNNCSICTCVRLDHDTFCWNTFPTHKFQQNRFINVTTQHRPKLNVCQRIQSSSISCTFQHRLPQISPSNWQRIDTTRGKCGHGKTTCYTYFKLTAEPCTDDLYYWAGKISFDQRSSKLILNCYNFSKLCQVDIGSTRPRGGHRSIGTGAVLAFAITAHSSAHQF